MIKILRGSAQRRKILLQSSTILKALAKSVDEVCVATDNDPTGEGQLLAFEVLLENNIRAKKFSRMWFADESKAEVQKAFKTRTTIPDLKSDPDYKKALFRSKWDSCLFSGLALQQCVAR